MPEAFSLLQAKVDGPCFHGLPFVITSGMLTDLLNIQVQEKKCPNLKKAPAYGRGLNINEILWIHKIYNVFTADTSI